MAIRGHAAIGALKQERYNRWRRLIRNDAFRTDLLNLIRTYSRWGDGPPLQVVLDQDDDCIDAELERKDAFLGRYRILDHGDDPFLLSWAKFRSDYGVALQEQIIEKIRLGHFPILEPSPALEWDALGHDDTILPPAMKLLNQGLEDIPNGGRGVWIDESYPKELIVELLKGYLPKKTTRSHRAKADRQLRLHDVAVKNRRAIGGSSTTRSQLKAATVAIGNPLPCVIRHEESAEERPESPREETQDLTEALSQLSAEQRNAFEAIALGGLTEQIYARQIGQPVAYVRILVQSARAQLQVCLQARGYEPPDSTEAYSVLSPGCRHNSRQPF